MRNSNRLLLSVCLAAAACTGHAVVTTGPGPSRPMPPPPPPGPGPAWHFDATGYELLGSAWVNGSVDHDVIPVGKREGVPFTNIVLVVTESDLEMLDMTVVFMNKDRWSPKVTHYFRENSRTRAIDLPGKARYIDHIEMTYRNLPGGGKAKVEIYGKNPHAASTGGEAPPPPPPPAPPPVDEKWDPTGWTMLGTQTVAGRRDKDVFAVGGKKFGYMDQIRVVVKDSDLEMADLVVAFENGDKFEPKLKHFFKEGQRSKVIELPGANRYIKNITVLYGNLPGTGAAKVEIWGRNLPAGKEKRDLKEPQKNDKPGKPGKG